jgi:triacylglycerol lipase
VGEPALADLLGGSLRAVVGHGMRSGFAAVAAALAMSLVGAPAAWSIGEADPAYDVPTASLEAAIACPAGLAHGRPVLLVHGTGSTGEESWSHSYAKVLPALGFDPCWVTMPGRTEGDIQVSSEYVAYAIGWVHAHAHAPLAVIGHSQGTLNARWALTFWPSTRPLVSDYISLAGDHHGASGADGVCATGSCPVSIWQQRPSSQLLAALNRPFEVPPGVPTTSVFSDTDEIVQPESNGPAATSWLRGASNIDIQSICPGRPVGHVMELSDAVVFAIVLDALRHDGPADPKRLPADVCQQTTTPGEDAGDVAYINAYAYGQALIAAETYPKVDREPPVACYATGTCPQPATAAPAAAKPKAKPKPHHRHRHRHRHRHH